MRYPLYLRVLAFFTSGIPVWLQDNECTVRASIAKTDPRGKMYCPVYPITNVGHCVLLEDGSVAQPHYCEKWKKA
jgi:hypothetical protein